MRRNLLSQMTNEWHDNIWIVSGLTIVSLAIWFFGGALLTTVRYYFTPSGFDREDVYVLSIGTHPTSSPDYIDRGAETPHFDETSKKVLLSRLRNSDNVEAAGFSENGAPYQLTFMGNNVRIAQPVVDTAYYYGNTRRISPELVKVLRLNSLSGKDGEYLQKRLEAGDILISRNDVSKAESPGYYRTWEEVAGKTVCGWDTTKLYRVADVVERIKRTDYDGGESYGDIIWPIDEAGDIGQIYDIMVRVKPGRGADFIEQLDREKEMTAEGNIYISRVESLSDMRKSIQRSEDMRARIYIVGIGFFLLIIFLGLLGTFWFRVQQRVGEIALRRVCGATRGDIFRRIIGEALSLLLVASVFVSIIGWVGIIYFGYGEKFTRIELIALELATLVLVAVGILASLVWPAWRGMNVMPADAVKDD